MNIHVRVNMETYIEHQMRYLRAKVKVAKEAKENGWPDLYRYSIKTAEEIIKEFEGIYDGNIRL